MKHITYLTLFLSAALQASPALYEGFDMPKGFGSALGSWEARSGASSAGWHSDWQQHEGESKVVKQDLAITGLGSSGGAIISKGKTIAMRQMAESFVGDVYGSFRVRGNKVNDNSIMGLLFSLPGEEDLSPKTALLGFMPMRWASPLGSLSIGGKISKIEAGQSLNPGQTGLVLWKIENLPEPGKRSDQVIHMWMLSEEQAAAFAAKGMYGKALEKATSGTEPGQVLQSIRVPVRNSKLTLVKGLVVSCFSYGVTGASFDEIGISRESLADAAGVGAKEPVTLAEPAPTSAPVTPSDDGFTPLQ